MKRQYITTLFLIFSFCALLVPQKGHSMTIYFTTLGNCGICQNRIQNAVKNLPGIDTVYWNISKKQTTVTYDEAVANPYTIMHAIAKVGHDNEWFRAPDSAYNLLVGSCCEYLRTIDYDTVKVGYLHLMGIWIYPLSIQNAGKSDFRVYPSIGKGIFKFLVNGSGDPDKLLLTVYSLSGTKVLAREVMAGPGSVDLTPFPTGEYIVVLSDKTTIVSSSRIIRFQ